MGPSESSSRSLKPKLSRAVLIVEDTPYDAEFLRRRLETLLADSEWFVLEEVPQSKEEAVRLLRENPLTRLVMVDAILAVSAKSSNEPRHRGRAATGYFVARAAKELSKNRGPIAVIGMSSGVTAFHIRRLIEAGVDAYYDKKDLANLDSLIRSITAHVSTSISVQAGRVPPFWWCSPTQVTVCDVIRNRSVSLSDSERSVLEDLCSDQSAQDVAEADQITDRAVQAKRKALREKVGVKTDAGLVKWAFAHGYADEDELT